MSKNYSRALLVSLICLIALSMTGCGGGGGSSADGSNGVGSECNRNQCNLLSLNTKEDKIINGQACDTTDSPVVQISIAPEGDFADTCTGTFIGASVILTAGHCLPASPGGVTILHNGVRHPAQEIFIHPNFRIDNEAGLVINDVATVSYTHLTLPTTPYV